MRIFALFTLLSFTFYGNERPNIVLILIDDLGFTDLGAYGGEIDTPYIDQLANNGLIFSNYHTSPECAPSRAMLLTGMDNHNTGIPMLPEVLPRKLTSIPGYEGYLVPEALTIAEILKTEGYQTYMTGKWHLGFGGEKTSALPFNRGFDRTFILDATGGDNFSNHSYLPYYKEAPWFKDGEPTQLPENFYSSEFLIDEMIEYIDGGDKNKPFFSYVSFQAQHIPLQVPKEYTQKYLTLYEEGWDVLRNNRLNAARDKGLFPLDAPIVDSLSSLKKWEEIDGQRKKFLIKSAAVFAGMLNAMDFHIGRLVSYLKENDLYENTIFIITADNGPEGNNPEEHQAWRSWIGTTSYTRNIDTLGEQNSYVFIGTEFAQAMASPHHMFKFHMNEGGLKVPLIMSGNGITKGVYSEFTYLTDIAATISKIITGEVPERMIGKSLEQVLRGSLEKVYEENEYIGLEVAGNSALFKGDYKILKNGPPTGDNIWHLYNLADDPGETNDLAKQKPDIFQQLLKHYDEYVADNGVIDLGPDYYWATEMTVNTAKRRFAEFIPGLIFIILVIGLIVIIYIRRR